ncbi:Crp/Fnr family transcriptional regulator [Chthonobacter rhizosphaerae]|uniref:Crp/Fnr family transcriptional regulator n=1 Tax=Chthonobacter rhizosphaerae TaxID=2735553 RepID=UPI0015EED9DB|nr:Crp/Fnr family transcriptional regulator [Chthonobacter rhizosphaerae]
MTELSDARPADPRATALAALPLFRSLSEADLAAAARHVRIDRHDEGQWIVAHEDEDREVHAVVSGRVRVMIFGETRELILGDLEAGAVFGDMSAIDGRPRSASVIALEPVTVATLPAAVFLDLIHRHPSVCDGVLRLLVARIRDLDHRVHELASLTVAERVRMELLRLARPVTGRPRTGVVPDVTHAEIAARIGTHREAVTRELGALARDGLIVKEAGRIVVADVLALSGRVATPAADRRQGSG